MAQRHSIPHFKPPIVDNKSTEGVATSGACHALLATPSSPKKYFFQKKWAWQLINKATPPIFRI